MSTSPAAERNCALLLHRKSTTRTRRGWKEERNASRPRFGSLVVAIGPLLVLLLLLQVCVPAEAAYANAGEDAETGGACVDADPVNCPFWAATGECQTNRQKMHARCKKSCNRCNVVRVNDQSEINRFIAQKKNEIEQMRRQRQQQQETLNILQGDSTQTEAEKGDPNRKLDGVVDPVDAVDTKPTTGTATTTETESGTETKTSTQTSNHSAAASAGMSETAPVEASEPLKLPTSRPAKRSAPAVEASEPLKLPTSRPAKRSVPATRAKGGKKPKMDAETGLECFDKNQSGNCPLWAARGECKTNRTYMHENCRLSCDRCHVVRMQNHQDISKFIARKNRENAKEIERKRKAREARRVLENGNKIGSGRDEL